MRPFLGTEALAAGALTRGALRWNYSAVHPNVYLPKGASRNLYVDTLAAWLWTRRTGIVAGKAAAALHGVDWIDETAPVELIATHGRRRPGVVIHEERIADDEIIAMGDLRVTTAARTALDLARRLPRDEALEHLDGLAARTGITAAEIGVLADRYTAAKGIRAARAAVPLMDGGASSPHQTRLRLILLDAGLPQPSTGICLEDPHWDAVVAIGWEGPRVGLEHEDELVGLNSAQLVAREELFQRLGWFRIRVLREHTRTSIVHRVRSAIRQRQ